MSRYTMIGWFHPTYSDGSSRESFSTVVELSGKVCKRENFTRKFSMILVWILKYPQPFTAVSNNYQARNCGGVLGVCTPALFLKRIKVAFFLINCESSVKKCTYVIIIKLECSESRKIPVIFLPFLTLKNNIQSYILFEKILVYPFLCIRPLPSKTSSCAPDYLYVVFDGIRFKSTALFINIGFFCLYYIQISPYMN